MPLHSCTVEFDRFDLATLRAALCLMQMTEPLPADVTAMASECGEFSPYSADEVSELLERIERAPFR